MAYTIGQILAVSYNAVVAEQRKAANQWVESAAMREMERQGMIVRKSLGPQIEFPIDYRRNPGGGFLTTDLQPLSTQKTEVISAAVYDIAEIGIPIVWSNKDEVMTPDVETQKIPFVANLVTNGLNTHDDLIEEAIFLTSTSGFLGMGTHCPTSGQGSDGGIDSAVETVWRCKSNTYTDDTDIEAGMTTTWNQCAKGSGSSLSPTLIMSDAATQGIFESSQQGQQRYVDSKELEAGFKILGFKTARYVFSQFGTTSLFFSNPKSLQIIASKQYFRHLGDTESIPNAFGHMKKIYSALQMGTGNRSRLGVLHV